MGFRHYLQQKTTSNVYYGSNVNKFTRKLEATGGTIIDDAGYRIHVFTSPGTFQVFTAGLGTVEYVVVAGGGGGVRSAGSNEGAGGGGAGGFRTGTSFPVTITS